VLDGRGSIPGNSEFFFSIPRRSGAYPIDTLGAGAFLGGKAMCEADLSLSSSAEVKNGGAVPSFPHTSSWCGANLTEHRDGSKNVILLWHVDPLLGNDREISKYATAVTRQRSISSNRETEFSVRSAKSRAS
jgi:hypothetical protein